MTRGRRPNGRVSCFLLALLVSGCAPPVRGPVSPGSPEGFPSEFYERAARSGAPVWRVEPAESEVLIHAYRAGPWARLGHNHVIVSRDVRGWVLPAGCDP